MRKIRGGLPVLLVASQMLIFSSAFSQDYQSAQVRVAAAREAMANGRWHDAEQVLLAGRADCASKGAGRTCRLLLDFNLGHYFERQSLGNPEQRNEFLKRSAGAYQRVLAEAPGHLATINNLGLVLRNLGRLDDLKRLLSIARATAPLGAAEIAVQIGDLERSKGRWEEAFAAYAMGASLAPGRELARRKIVEIIGHVSTDRSANFVDDLHQWELTFPAVAEDGFSAIVRYFAADSPSLAEQALLHWVALVAEQRAISIASVERAFSRADYAPARELAAFLAYLGKDEPALFASRGDIESFLSDSLQSDGFSWWTSTEERRHVLGLAALSFGRSAVVAKEPKQAQRRWILGLHFAPRIEKYIDGPLDDHTYLPLNLVTQLAWLQFRYPQLDHDEQKFRLFIDLLFDGKAQSYRSRDLRAIQRHHTVLGEIFAAKGIWESAWADNAIFQLSHAISTAQIREQQEGFYDPLPGLKARLAAAYAIVDKPKEALTTTIDAAQAYLDLDEMDRASELLNRASELLKSTTDYPARPAQRERIAALEEVLDTRQAVRTLLEAAGEDGPPPSSAWLTARDLPGVSRDFLRRHQFKIHTDLAEIAELRGDEAAAVGSAQAALTAAEQVTGLAGMADVQRLERIATLVKANGKDAETGYRVHIASQLAQYENLINSWQLSLPWAQVPIYVALSRDPVIATGAGQIAAARWQVQFDSDSANLSPSEVQDLRFTIETLKAVLDRGGSRIVLTGHSDTKGNRDYNLMLSRIRANNVAELLEQQGVARDQIKIDFVGESQLRVPTGDEIIEPANRVVEIFVQ